MASNQQPSLGLPSNNNNNVNPQQNQPPRAIPHSPSRDALSTAQPLSSAKPSNFSAATTPTPVPSENNNINSLLHNQKILSQQASDAAQNRTSEDDERAADRQLEADCLRFAKRIKELAENPHDQTMLVRKGVVPALLGFLRAKANVGDELISTTIDILRLVSSHPKNREFLRNFPDFLRTMSEVHEDCNEPESEAVREESAKIIRNVGLSITSTVGKYATNITHAKKLELMQIATRKSFAQIQLQEQLKAHLENAPGGSASSFGLETAEKMIKNSSSGNHCHSVLTRTLKDIDLETAFARLEQIEAEKALQAQVQTGNISNLKMKKLSSRTSEGQRLQEAARIISRDGVSKQFRSQLRIALAVLAVFNFFQVIFFFFLVHPPGLKTADRNPISAKNLNVSDVVDLLDHWIMPDEVGAPYRREFFILEGLMQLLVSLTAVAIFVAMSLTRRPKVFPQITFIPRNAVTTATDEESFFSNKQKREILIWCFHCPVGFAFFNEDFRYLNGVCVLRLYTIIRASMDLSQFKSSMVRIMANFFGLRLTTSVFFRWALEFHKWKVLLPLCFFCFGFLTLCFSFAEGLSLYTSAWFMMVTITSTGYGDVYPYTAAGRFSAVMAMLAGMVGLAYVVSQVETLVRRPEHEKKVMDALTKGTLRRRSREEAARLMWYRYKMSIMMRKWKKYTDEQAAYNARWAASSGDVNNNNNRTVNNQIPINQNNRTGGPLAIAPNNNNMNQNNNNNNNNNMMMNNTNAIQNRTQPIVNGNGGNRTPLPPAATGVAQPNTNTNTNNQLMLNNNNNVNRTGTGVPQVVANAAAAAVGVPKPAPHKVQYFKVVEYEFLKQAAAKASAELTGILREIQLLPPIHDPKEQQLAHVHETIDMLKMEQAEQTKLINALTDTVHETMDAARGEKAEHMKLITSLTDAVMRLHKKLDAQDAEIKKMREK